MLLLSIPYDYCNAKDLSAVIKYQVDENYPPFTYTNEKYVYGFDPDLTNLIFKSADYVIEYSYDSWPKVYDRLLSGEIDIAGIIAITEERKQQVLFTDTLFNAYISIYTLNGRERVTTQDLPGLTVGVGRGYYSESILLDRQGITDYIPYDDLSQAISDLNDGTIDVIFENQNLMENLLVSSRYKGKIVAQVKDLYPLPHAYAVNKDKPELVDYMNQRIGYLKRKGIFEEVYTKYFYSHSEHYEGIKIIKMTAIAAVIFLSVLIILLALKIYIRYLKKKLDVNYINLWQAKEELYGAHEELQAQYEEIQAQVEEVTQSKIELKKSEERYRLVVEGANEGLWDWDILEDTIYLTEKWARHFGYENAYIRDFMPKWLRLVLEEDIPIIQSIYRSSVENKASHMEVEFRIAAHSAQLEYISVRAKIVYDLEGRPIRMAGSISDISERKDYDNKIYRMAYYDSLTGLPNRLLLSEHLNNILKTEGSTLTAVLYIDLDNFKHINDTMGHDVGDLLLRAIATSLLEDFGNSCFISRIGGDEFIVIVEGLETRQEIVTWADLLLKRFVKKWEVADFEVYVSTSIGITVIPEDGRDIKKILKNADTAMYAAKGDGRGNYKFFREDMLLKVAMRAEMECSIRKALENNEFVLYYQPYYSTATGSMEGMEALIRWLHPTKGMISPIEFIPLAEETGLINEIGRWVIKEVCEQCSRWERKGLHTVPIAFNVSELQLENLSFEEELINRLMESGLNPSSVQIEITESVIIKSIERCTELLNRLRRFGIKISLDDFGTGYSSLHYIQLLPIDTIKIDRSFVKEISLRAHDGLIIGDIISIAHRLNMQVIAEGVETEEQLDYLKGKACDIVQGFLYCKPIPGTAIEKLLEG